MGNAESRRALLTVILLLFFLPVSGENFSPHFYFKNISVSEGLSHNTVNDILQDRTGFMWFATKDGLDRYDGNKIKRYGYSSLPGSLKSNCVNKLYEDGEGMIGSEWNNRVFSIFLLTGNGSSISLFQWMYGPCILRKRVKSGLEPTGAVFITPQTAWPPVHIILSFRIPLSFAWKRVRETTC